MGWASALLAVVLASTLAVITIGWIYMLLTLWALRKQFEIAVRCPSLNAVVQITVLLLVMSILLHWLLLIMNEGLPCVFTFWVSYAVLAFAVAPSLLRAARLVIACSRLHRNRFARFVKTTTTTRVWTVATVALFVRGVFFFGSKPEHYSRNARDCFYMDDTALVLGITLILGPPAMLLALGLSNVDDAFKIREELLATMIGGFCASGVVQSIQILVVFDLLRDTPQLHIVVETLTLLFGINAGVWGLLIPMVRAHRDGLHAQFRGGIQIVPAENADDVDAAADVEGVLLLVTKGGEMADKFEAFCGRHLCQESWDFIVDATHYENMAFNGPDKQFDAFLHVLDQYLLPTSPSEVNISGAASKRVSAIRAREVFGHLEDAERREVFREPLAEIVQMLEENLLNKFRSHVAMERDVQLAKLAGEDRELMRLMKASQLPRSFKTRSTA